MAVFRSSFSLTNVIGSCRNFLLPRICVPSYERYLSVRRKNLEEEIGLPPRPKRPVPPFFKYLSMKRSVTMSEHPELKPCDITKLLSEGWAMFDPIQKDRLQKEYDEEMRVYAKIAADYKKLITPEQKLQLKSANEQKRLHKEKLKERQRRELLGRPRKPMNAFFQYVYNQQHMYDKTKTTYQDFLSRLKEEYEVLPESKKAELRDKSRKELQEYKVAMLEWEQKMIRLGHTDVVRYGAVLKPEKQNKE